MTAATPEPACECEEHPCRPVPGQTARFRVGVGPLDQGVVELCAWCYVNGCMWRREQRWKEARAKEAIRAQAS